MPSPSTLSPLPSTSSPVAPLPSTSSPSSSPSQSPSSSPAHSRSSSPSPSPRPAESPPPQRPPVASPAAVTTDAPPLPTPAPPSGDLASPRHSQPSPQSQPSIVQVSSERHVPATSHALRNSIINLTPISSLPLRPSPANTPRNASVNSNSNSPVSNSRHSNRWNRFLNFFHPSRRRRASHTPSSQESRHLDNQSPRHAIDPSTSASATNHRSLPPILLSSSTSPLSSITRNSAPNHNASNINSNSNNHGLPHTSTIGIRRATRRERNQRLRQLPSRDREQNRRTMSDGALSNTAMSTNNSNNTSTNSTTQSPHSLRTVSPSTNNNSSNINNSPSPTIISARTALSRSGRMPFPHSVTNMRYRRMSSGRDGAIGVSINGNVPVSVRSTTFGLSDHVNGTSDQNYALHNVNENEDANGYDDTLHSLRNAGSSTIATGISIGGGGSSTGATSIQGNATSVSSSPRSTDSRASTLVSSSLADIDGMPEHDLLAVFNRIFDDYPGPPTADMYGQQQQGENGTGNNNSNSSNQQQQHHVPVYLGRVPSHARQRLAMRIPNAYLIPGRRHGRGSFGGNGNGNGSSGNGVNGEGSNMSSFRIGMGVNHGQHHQRQHENHHQRHWHHHLYHGHAGPMSLHEAFGHSMGIGMGLGPEVFSFTAADGRNGNGRGCENRVATDEEIEALPSFVMEKGDTRSVRQVFASMRLEKVTKKTNDGDDETKTDDVCDNMDDLVDTVVVDEEDEEETTGNCQAADQEADGNKEEHDDSTMTSYTECAICLCDFEPGDEIASLPCGHFFHLNECVREWLSKHARTCPTCRADICETRLGAEELN